MTKVSLMLLVLISFCFSCSKSTIAEENFKKRKLARVSKKYIGVPYRYGGEDRKGMDCSGLVWVSFQVQNIVIPRVSYQQADYFKEIKLRRARKGDLLYFATSGNGINHTGIVNKRKSKNGLEFIHASTSSGVKKDNLNSSYWKSKLVKVTRPKF